MSAPIDSPAYSPLVTVTGLSRRFYEGECERVVLDEVNLEIGRGESLALLGRSGAGKSSLLNLLGGIDRPDSGEIVIDGIPLTRLDEHARTLFRRRHIGFVYQFFNLIPTLTVLENVCLPVELKGEDCRRGQRRALELLDAVGLAGRRDSFPDRLSGGEQQRVAIARALVHEPLLVLADEPTGNLDAESGERIAELLFELVRGQGRTLVLVTHSRPLADRADRILTLHQGHLHAGPLEAAE